MRGMLKFLTGPGPIMTQGFLHPAERSSSSPRSMKPGVSMNTPDTFAEGGPPKQTGNPNFSRAGISFSPLKSEILIKP